MTTDEKKLDSQQVAPPLPDNIGITQSSGLDHHACIFRLHPAACTEKSCHSAGKNLPRYRISLPVITNIGKM